MRREELATTTHVLLFFFRETETSTILFASFPTPLSTLDRRAALTRRTRGSVDRQLYTYKKISKNNKLTSLFVEEKNKTISLFVEQRQYDWDPAATICFFERLSDISARTCVYIISYAVRVFPPFSSFRLARHTSRHRYDYGFAGEGEAGKMGGEDGSNSSDDGDVFRLACSS